MIDLKIVFDVLLVTIVCWNSIDIYNMKKENKVIKQIQNGEDVSAGEPFGEPNVKGEPLTKQKTKKEVTY